jgi:CheY-like chemotaxis protein
MHDHDPGQSPRLLVAEDHRVNRLLIERILKSLGYRTVMVENGLEAVDAVRAGLRPTEAASAAQADSFDAVLLDLEMPVMDGLEAASAIRALGGEAEYLPLLALTAHAAREVEADARQHGFDGFVSKPVTAAELAAALRELIP